MAKLSAWNEDSCAGPSFSDWAYTTAARRLMGYQMLPAFTTTISTGQNRHCKASGQPALHAC